MSKATNLEDLYDRWSAHAVSKHECFGRSKKLFPMDLNKKHDRFTERQIRRFLQGLHKGVYPRGNVWRRIY
ncbi:TPA: hypothetical protein ACOEOW_003907 [Enterobacter hormaechei subsp. xiangfangensis]